MLLKKLRLSAVVSVHFPNALPMQRLEDLHVIYQSQVTCHGLSYESVSFSSATFPKENFHCVNILLVVWEEVLAEGIFDK